MTDHGEMNTNEHKQMYADFLALVKWSSIGIAVVLVILAITVV